MEGVIELEVSNIPIKTCTKCKIEYEATTVNFVKQKNGKFGLSSVCKPCQKLWRDERKDIKKEYDKQYNEANLEYRKEYSKKRYREKYDEIREYSRNRYKDPEFIKQRREYRKTRKSRDKELFNKWRLANPKRISTNKQRRYTKVKGLLSNMTHEEWENCIAYFNNSCAYCGVLTDELTRDHFIPVTKNGTFTVDNIIPACISCNSSKNNRDFSVWYPRYEHYLDDRETKILNYLYNNKLIHNQV